MLCSHNNLIILKLTLWGGYDRTFYFFGYCLIVSPVFTYIGVGVDGC